MLGIDDAVAAVANIGGKIIDRLFPDPVQAADAKLKLLQMQQTGELAKLTAETDLMKGQLAVNQAEAGSTSLFVAGWRPFVGWVCGAAFGYKFIAQPFLVFALLIFLPDYPVGKLPVLDWTELSAVLFGILGLGYYRSSDKKAGVASGH